MNYTEKLLKALQTNQSCLCVGLDPDLSRIPDSIKQQGSGKPVQVVSFLKKVIDSTRDHCAAYKPNLGFFEALGAPGLEVFQQIIDYIPDDKVVIADVKRGDISSTATHYAKAYFEVFDADAVTINPLMGFETLDPFLMYPDKGIYTLTLTSNTGAKDFLMQNFMGQSSMAVFISKKLREIQKMHQTHLGMVIGATKAGSMAEVIKNHPEGSLLIPGIGAQGGSITDLQNALKKHKGMPLINSSRGIIYAGEGTENWQQAVREKSKELKEALYPITRNYVN